MRKTLPEIYDAVKKIALKIFKVLENVWVKRVATILITVYAVYLLYSNYRTLKDSVAALTLNIPLIVLSAGIVLLTFILNISSWKFIVASLGYDQKWMDMAHVQMTSAIGKYIPGKIWNYSSKIYLSHKLGLPGSIASLALGVEVLLAYIIGACLFLIFVPAQILNVNSGLIIAMRITGGLLGSLVCIAPLLLSKINLDRHVLQKTEQTVFLNPLQGWGLGIFKPELFLFAPGVGLFTHQFPNPHLSDRRIIFRRVHCDLYPRWYFRSGNDHGFPVTGNYRETRGFHPQYHLPGRTRYPRIGDNIGCLSGL